MNQNKNGLLGIIFLNLVMTFMLLFIYPISVLLICIYVVCAFVYMCA